MGSDGLNTPGRLQGRYTPGTAGVALSRPSRESRARRRGILHGLAAEGSLGARTGAVLSSCIGHPEAGL